MQFVLYIKGKEENTVKNKGRHNWEVDSYCYSVNDNNFLNTICAVAVWLKE